MGEQAADTAIARCPACGKLLSYRQLAFGAEHHAIRCKTCDARLIKNTGLFPIVMLGGLAGMVTTRFFFKDIEFYWHAGWVGTLLLIAFLSAKVSIAGDDIPDKPKDEVPDRPPPQSTYFRGSSGPPPKRED